LCCLAFRLTHVVILTGDIPRKLCAAVGVESEGTVQVLRRRLVVFFRPTPKVTRGARPWMRPPEHELPGYLNPVDDQGQVRQADSCVPVLFELLRKV
jgi:hypothetical protein